MTDPRRCERAMSFAEEVLGGLLLLPSEDIAAVNATVVAGGGGREGVINENHGPKADS